MHGLMGDSRLTWMHGNDSTKFWPKWLVADSGFSHARIHTYGYNWTPESGMTPIGSLWELGEALYDALEQCIRMRGDSQVRHITAIKTCNGPDSLQNPIIFIAHSYGGLVVKAVSTHLK